MTTLLQPPTLIRKTEPDAPAGAKALILASLETMTGRRPLHQLRPHLSERAFQLLAHYVATERFRRVRVARIRTQMPTPRAVEATVALQTGQRWLSVVIRLDAKLRSWECTEFMVLAPGPQSWD